MTQGTAGRREERHDRYIELIKQFTIMNDIFMRNVLKEKACTEFILQIITENIGLRIVEQVLQMDYANLHGRAARLDCVALDTANKVYNLEIQQENEGALPKRPRYHASLLDVNILEPGTEFQNLPCTTVIFITKNDVLGGGLPIYHISRTVREVEADFGDELDIIYVNGSNHDDTELGRLIHDLNCREGRIHIHCINVSSLQQFSLSIFLDNNLGSFHRQDSYRLVHVLFSIKNRYRNHEI